MAESNLIMKLSQEFDEKENELEIPSSDISSEMKEEIFEQTKEILNYIFPRLKSDFYVDASWQPSGRGNEKIVLEIALYLAKRKLIEKGWKVELYNGRLEVMPNY